MSRYYSYETIRANAYDVTLANGAKHRCIDPDVLLDIEPADVRENVRGEWIDITMWHDEYFGNKCQAPAQKCSNCGEWSVGINKKFCSNCGADMRGEE